MLALYSEGDWTSEEVGIDGSGCEGYEVAMKGAGSGLPESLLVADES